MDERIKKLAYNLVNVSCRVKEGEHVLIDAGTEAKDLTLALIKEIYALKAYPHISLKDSSISRALYMDCAQNQLRAMSEIELERIKRMDAYIGISVTDNTYEMSDVPAQNMEMANKMMKEALSYRVDHTKWVILRFPNGSMAQAAKMSKEAFENYYYDYIKG